MENCRRPPKRRGNASMCVPSKAHQHIAHRPCCHTWLRAKRWPQQRGCHQAPRLPRKRNVDVAKCHTCHPKCRGGTGDQRRPSAPPDAAKCPNIAPRLPRKSAWMPPKFHACHAKLRSMSPTERRACHAKCRGATGDHQRKPSAQPDPAQCHKC